jgi:hypothetical protein
MFGPQHSQLLLGVVLAVNVWKAAIRRLVTTIPNILRCQSGALRYLPLACLGEHTPPKPQRKHSS